MTKVEIKYVFFGACYNKPKGTVGDIFGKWQQ